MTHQKSVIFFVFIYTYLHISKYFLDLISQYSGHKNETAYSKISISNDGRYLFSGCIEQKGVIWLTDFPYEENPMFTISDTNDSLDTNIEFSNSDWCADSACFKVSINIVVYCFYLYLLLLF